jgi:Nuclease-related domain
MVDDGGNARETGPRSVPDLVGHGSDETGLGNGPGGRPWVRRADVDRRSRLRATLEMAGGEDVIVLNDRRIPGSRATIPMIAVASAGVFVIDARHHKGLVHTKRLGAFDRLDPPELLVGRKNCTSSLDALARQVEIVRATLDGTPWGSEVTVTAMLCLTRAEWGLASSTRIRDVWVGWPRLMAGTVCSPGVMDSPSVREVAQVIGTRLPA